MSEKKTTTRNDKRPKGPLNRASTSSFIIINKIVTTIQFPGGKLRIHELKMINKYINK